MLRRFVIRVSRAMKNGATSSKVLSEFNRRINSILNHISDNSSYVLLQELIRNPAQIGAICSSSKWLAAEMAALVDLNQKGVVFELGGGTGAITAELLRYGVSEDKLIVVERSLRLARYLRRRFPKVRIIHGDAAEVADILVRQQTHISTVVSGLPLQSLHADIVSSITEACTQALSSNGHLIQFTYAMRGASAWLATGLIQVNSEMVWMNIPPARIQVFARVTR